jgi:hypothetical protein
MKEDRYQQPDALLAYFRRIGAEVINFQRAMVKEHRGAYYVERTIIKILPDGSIDCSRPEHRPSKEEADAIKEALKTCQFPVSVDATEAACKALIEKRAGDRAKYYLIRNRSSGKVSMMQERVDNDDGTKRFVSHSLWSDNNWRTMEPDSNKLPFWKPREKREGTARLMVHEGAKAASFIDWLVNDRSPEAKVARENHPWLDELASYEHWGMIGGALAPGRTDYGEIRKEQPIEVVYVCDNDFAGRSVVRDFAGNYGGSLKGIIFDNRFKESWDMADPLPEQFFAKRKGVRKWHGPPLRSFMHAATFATETIPNPAGVGRPVAVLKRSFKEEWMHCVSPEVFIHRDWPDKVLDEKGFNNLVRPYSDVDDTARLLKADQANKSRQIHYEPGSPPGFYGNNLIGQFINTYSPSPIKPDKKYREGDAQPWLDFIDMLIIDEVDKLEVLRWCATLIAKPAVKMHYGLLLISETQGVGKTTLGSSVLTPLIGAANVSSPSESDIVESQFNGWIAHKRLAIVNEIYAGASTKAYNKLKSVITDDYIMVNKKHQSTYEIKNWLHIFACSNSKRALKLSIDDRRWFVPAITEKKPTTEYWTGFYDWLENENGLSSIAAWAERWVLDNRAVVKGDPAPDSAAKRAMIDDSMSPGMTLACDIMDQWKLENEGREVIWTDQQMIEYIKNQVWDGKHSDRLERPETIRKLAKGRGWFIGETRTRRWSSGVGLGRLISNYEHVVKRDPEALWNEGKELLAFPGQSGKNHPAM